jgi:hypothetical protein
VPTCTVAEKAGKLIPSKTAISSISRLFLESSRLDFTADKHGPPEEYFVTKAFIESSLWIFGYILGPEDLNRCQGKLGIEACQLHDLSIQATYGLYNVENNLLSKKKTC